MSERNRVLVTGTAIASAVGICILVAKYRMQILKQIKWIVNYNNPLRNQQIQVVGGVEECRLLMRNLKTYVIFVHFNF